MANNCSTQIRFYGNEEAIGDLLKRVKYAISEGVGEEIKGCREQYWLGNVTREFGIDFEAEEISVRGSIDCVDEDTNTIYTDTAWVPKLQMWNAIIAKHYSDDSGEPLIYFDWLAEEFGCDIYCTNNISEFSGMNYCVDYEIGNNADMEYGFDEDDILEIINNALEEAGMKPIGSISEVEDIYDELDEQGWFISVHELEEVDTCYFD